MSSSWQQRIKGSEGTCRILVLIWAIIAQWILSVDGGTEKEILDALDEAAAEGSWGYVPLSGPYIDINHSDNVTAQVGSTAILNCRILYIVGKPVSWMRARDLHLLTVGRFTYTSDDRFKAVHQSGSQDWLLKIHYLQERDRGPYECQVATTPPITHTVWLNVVEPQTVVLGGPDLYINAGSIINLTCVVKHSPQPPPYIFWYHDEVLLSYDNDDSGRGIQVVTESGEDTFSSQLIIDRAKPPDSGIYACLPATAPPHNINVHIINSEEPAAIHHKNTTSSSAESGSICFCPQLPLQIVLLLLIPLLTGIGDGEGPMELAQVVSGGRWLWKSWSETGNKRSYWWNCLWRWRKKSKDGGGIVSNEHRVYCVR